MRMRVTMIIVIIIVIMYVYMSCDAHRTADTSNGGRWQQRAYKEGIQGGSIQTKCILDTYLMH